METRIVALLLQILERIRTGESIHRVRGHLLERGHSSSDVSLALTYLLHVSDAYPDLPAEVKMDEPSGIRVLSETESWALSSEAYGYLLKLRELNLISALQMEQIVDELLMSTDEIAGVEDVKEVVARFLVEDSSLKEHLPLEEEPETEH